MNTALAEVTFRRARREDCGEGLRALTLLTESIGGVI